MKAVLLVATCVILVLAGAGCSQPSATVVTDQDDGSTVYLSVGDTLEVRLEANATTGYEWGVDDPAPGNLQLSSSEYEPGPPNLAPVAGSGGTAVFVFEAVAMGDDTLSLTYEQPWEAGETADHWSLDVKVAR